MKNLGWNYFVGFLTLAFVGCGQPASDQPSSNTDGNATTSSVPNDQPGSFLQSITKQTSDSPAPDSESTAKMYPVATDVPTKRSDSAATTGRQGPELCADSEDQATPPVRYWIGVCSQRAPTSLLAQLHLKCGVVIDRVFDGSPAYQQLQKHDVIYQIDGQPVRCGTSLGCGINEKQGKTLTFSVYRNGKPLEISITPSVIKQVGNEIIQFTHFSDFDKIMSSAAFEGVDLDNPSQQYELVFIRPGFELEPGETSSKKVGCQGDLTLQMSLSFRETEAGEMVVVVRQNNVTSEYSQANIAEAPEIVQKFLNSISVFGENSDSESDR